MGSLTSESDLFADFEAQFTDAEEPEVEDFSKLSDFQLAQRFDEVIEELKQRKEQMHQTTDRGRELQSLRAAILVVMNNRR